VIRCTTPHRSGLNASLHSDGGTAAPPSRLGAPGQLLAAGPAAVEGGGLQPRLPYRLNATDLSAGKAMPRATISMPTDSAALLTCATSSLQSLPVWRSSQQGLVAAGVDAPDHTAPCSAHAATEHMKADANRRHLLQLRASLADAAAAAAEAAEAAAQVVGAHAEGVEVPGSVSVHDQDSLQEDAEEQPRSGIRTMRDGDAASDGAADSAPDPPLPRTEPGALALVQAPGGRQTGSAAHRLAEANAQLLATRAGLVDAQLQLAEQMELLVAVRGELAASEHARTGLVMQRDQLLAKVCHWDESSLHHTVCRVDMCVR
jgi:hypothetical protein